MKYSEALKGERGTRLASYTWGELREQALKRDRRKCKTCKATERLEVDHIKPVALGGKNELKNLQTLCSTCHNKKTRADTEMMRRAKYVRRLEKGREEGWTGFKT